MQGDPKPNFANRYILQGEGALIAIAGIVLYAQHGFSWLLFAALILLPDLAMIGYVRGPRVGAILYNIGHSYIAPLILLVVAQWAASETATAIGLIWGVHIGADRALGYGLKYPEGFKSTHLGRV
jgi:hypothetical protein